MYYDEKIETISSEQLQALQLERLKDMIKRIYDKNPVYKEKLDEAGVSPNDIASLKDLAKMPFTYKQDLRDHYPFGLFTAKRADIARIHASSGTTGKPTVVGYTHKDLDVWAELIARGIVASGGSKEDIVQVAYGYGLFTGGLGLHYGAEKLGATALPMSSGNTKKQIMLMKDFGSNILGCTPSYALYIADVARERGALKDLKLRTGIFGAEPWSENMRKEIERKLNIKAYDIYGLSEIMGPGVAVECEAQNGMHIWEDHFIPEIINPDTGEVLPDGEVGELVITTITKEGIPLLRYRTRDITRIIPKPCSCGRTHRRIERITARTDDMLIIRGVNVYPSQIEEVILEMSGVEPHYQLIITREGFHDELEVRVEIGEELVSDTIKNLEMLENKITNSLKSVLGLSAKVKLVEPESIPRSQGKAVRVIDKRKEE